MKKIWKIRKQEEAVSPVIATILMVAIVYHVGAIGYRKYVHRRPAEMLPMAVPMKVSRNIWPVNTEESISLVTNIWKRPSGF